MGKPMKNKSSWMNEKGMALIATMIFLMAMGVLATALVYTVQNEMKTSSAYKYSQQAVYVANAGVQNAVQWFQNTYTPSIAGNNYTLSVSPVTSGGSAVLLAGQTGSSANYPDSAKVSSFHAAFNDAALSSGTNNGAFSVNATLLKHQPANFINPVTFLTYDSAIERWRLNSVARWGSNVNNPLGMAQVTAVVENSGNALFDRALWGINSIDLGGTMRIDSYDPRLGLWNSTTNSGNLGSIGSNGWVDVGGNAIVRGDAVYGPNGTYTVSGSATVTGAVGRLSAPRYFPPIPSFGVGATNKTVNPSNSDSIIPGNYKDINVKGTLSFGPGVYYIDTLTVTSQGQIVISDSTTLFVKSSLQMEGQGVANTSLDPTNLIINYAGTTQVKMTGGSQAYIELYAPNAPVQLNGNMDFFGSFIGKDVEITGGPKIHFSLGCLQNSLMQRPFRLITWVQDSL
jgi:type II secretory pathway pseudopilin PulG